MKSNNNNNQKKKKNDPYKMFQTQMGEVVFTVATTTLKPKSPAKSISNK